ncbi:cytochrome P450 [Fomitopsis serialis]|uniref:cytochrome P450 n=1 Tax=Fomitopsis serialis TaxID=139415 RepID=UPI002007C3EF|nr:cytochrome P450 [Neoantrodia serialis]KAH9915855.1 cytochrome P450 [Neoantrodia serialis]
MADAIQVAGALIGIFAVTILLTWRFDPLYSIPTIGPSLPLLSYIGAYRYSKNAREVLQEGYAKYKIFKVAMLDQWVVIVSGADMNEELRKVPDSHATFHKAAEDFIQLRYTVSNSVVDHPIHIPTIRGPLTKNLGVVFGDVVDEINAAFTDTIGSKLQGDEWISVNALMTMAVIISRVSNRVFVGLPLCRNEDYLQIVRQFTFDVSRARFILSWFPKSLKKIVGPFIPWARRATQKASVHLRPIIEDRFKKLKEMGEDWADKPNDYMMWIINEARREGGSVQAIIEGLMVSNFAAIHTSSNSMTQALYHLAESAEYVKVLREEVDSVVKEHGWTKVATGKMWKLDSFMRESQRINGITYISIMRKTLQDTTLSDGTFIPADTLVAGASNATHRDPRNYENPEVFDPFRFADLREEDGASIKHQFVSTSPEYVPFGHGKHACPGRFFAVNELKLMMAYILLHYDLKFEGEQRRPENWSRWHNVLPAHKNVLVRRRQVVAT